VIDITKTTVTSAWGRTIVIVPGKFALLLQTPIAFDEIPIAHPLGYHSTEKCVVIPWEHNVEMISHIEDEIGNVSLDRNAPWPTADKML
jgi:hypothetical protein